ncbi:BZ3500_MvSof-1268-A1-R1_Chr7-3g09653 [Microbotryum saponariae]|uniref:BZ3500_MvSof-1268-A1-R1_Chr7-3g09653 protein n=1 Tax=Microbotryum saponariae TaxID=289078 RepID=A0A2X0LSU7_9BASI|nr:BZ3501_MvSof-1269-A2-R1_Chr7-2g09376 [Microbotryum saponariae]SDA02353.1 BZ3500_MvSof-1268-A1-R1_Chr7-3g09653 [Microbotryum saponariae]
MSYAAALDLVRPSSQLGRDANVSHHTASDGPFIALHSDFASIVGANPKLDLIASTEKSRGGNGVSLFHEAGVWAPQTKGSDQGDVYITSNIIGNDRDGLEIKVCRLRFSTSSESAAKVAPSKSDSSVLVVPGVEYEDLQHLADEVVMANGATAYGSNILWCSQGQHKKFTAPLRIKLESSEDPKDNRVAGSLILSEPQADGTFKNRTLLNHFRGREFNALNDVAVHPQSGCIFFTDPDYGLEQGFKGPSQLPNGVWRYCPKTGALGMVADGLCKPNGIVCSPDGKTCYVTDTDYIHGDGTMVSTRMGAIYAYDILHYDKIPQLHNKRLFALVDCGAPDGIKVDELGNIYTGTFEGVDVYHPDGYALGKIVIPKDDEGNQRGCANLVFGPKGKLVILSETTVWVASIAQSGELKGLEVA